MRYLDADAAARYAGYCQPDDTVTADNRKRFYDWVARHHVKKFHAGRRLRFRSTDIDAAMEGRDLIVERALHLASGGKA